MNFEPDIDLQALVQNALALATRLLGLEAGLLGRLDGDVWAVEACYAPGSGLEPGQTLALGDTCCALAADGPVAVEALSRSEHRDHPCRAVAEATIGAPVRVGNTRFGVLSFWGAHEKTPPFTDADRELVALLAQSVGATRACSDALAALRREKELSERIVESSFDGIVAFDRAQRYTAWNAGMERITGMPREQVLGRVTYEVFPFLETTGAAEAQRAALRGETVTTRGNAFNVPETGRHGYFEARYSPLRAADGEIVGGLGINRDTTEQIRAREQIERSEQLLAGVLLGSLDGIVALEAVRDAEGRVEDFVWRLVNPAAAEMYGQPAEDLLGARYLSVVLGVRDAGIFDTFLRVLETGEPYRDVVYYDADGFTGWFDFTVVKLGDGVAQTFRDITEQKEAEAALRESEGRFRELFEASPDPIFVEDLDGVVLDVNPAACRLHNTGRDWLIGRSLLDLVPPAYHDDAKRDFDRLAAGELGLLESLSYTADGLVVPVEVRTSRITYAGQPAVLLHVRDVTEREAAEHALRESEERFAKAFHASPIAVSISTLRDTRFIDVNESFCDLTGYARDELIGRTSDELGLGPIFTGQPHLVERLRSGGALRDLEFELRTRGGEVRDIIASAELIEIGGTTCLLGLGFDATQRKRLEREVIETAEAERRRIGQDLHDELGQQLTGAAFLGQVLAQRLAARNDPETEGARQLTALINRALAEMRDLSRLLSPVDVQAEGLMDALRELADQTERVFAVACWLRTEGDVRVADNAAATHLFRIAQEAVNNAVKHADPTEITIALTHDDEGLCLEITDDGTGIDPAMLQQPSGLGLRTMQYRTALIGARLHVGPAERGSLVAVFLPDAKEKRSDAS